MMRAIISFLSLGVVGGWIALNYLPVDLASTNGLMQNSRIVMISQWLLIIGAAVFVMLQLALVDSSVRLGELMNEHKSTHAINLNVMTEVMWTALPLVSTFGLIVVCYSILV